MYHIALVTTSYPSSEDGSEAAGSFVADFANVLSQYVKVSIIAPSLQASITEISPQLSIYRFAVSHLPLSTLKVYNPLHWLPIMHSLQAGSQTLERIAQQHQLDHIIALWALPSGYWAKRVGARHRVSYSTWVLGSDIWNLGRMPIVKTLLQRVLQDSQCNFANGYLLKQAVEELSQRPCEFLPSTRQLNMTEHKVLTAQPPYKLAFLGCWDTHKGIDLLLDCLQSLNDEDWSYIKEVRIAGGGGLARKIQKVGAVLQAQQRPVSLQGFLNKPAATQLLQWADYVLIPSRIESIPVIFSDAMKCQAPVISMPVGDLPRLIDEYQVGIVASNVSVPAFTHAIQQALRIAPQSFALGLSRAAEEFSVKYSVQAFLTQIGLD